MLRAKTLTAKPEPDDGYRLLVCATWPRGFKESWADGFNPHLAPPPELLDPYLRGEMAKGAFEARYAQHLAAHADRLASLAQQARSSPITLVSPAGPDGHSVAEILCARVASAPAPESAAQRMQRAADRTQSAAPAERADPAQAPRAGARPKPRKKS